jgi:hypothetical protein
LQSIEKEEKDKGGNLTDMLLLTREARAVRAGTGGDEPSHLMGDLKRGLGVVETRAWLDENDFTGKFVGWKSDALLGADKSGILMEVPGLQGERLWGLLNTSISSNQGERIVS